MFQVDETRRRDIGGDLIQGHEEKLLDGAKTWHPIRPVYEANI